MVKILVSYGMTDNLKIVDFQSALSDRYLSYALSTIVSRSLPDVRDGLKPVHRRLLYAMHELKLDPKSGFKKCARIVGDVIGKFHPHGEVAVYDALVRMAQSFSSRYPIIEGQGNFGSIDGDSQAAMRYTEAKLTPYALLLLKDLESGTVDFRPNYDGSDDEPIVMPSAVPNILANGTEGIAVGMATSIPPHNILELIDATLHLLAKPQAEVVELLKFVKGPDFPTGGDLVESADSIGRSYLTGRGSFRLRAKWAREDLERGQYRIVITEIPYQVQKRNLIEKLAELFNAKKLQFLDDIEDMSAEDIRIVLTPKNRNLSAESIMETLFKLTDLEVKVQLNMNVLGRNSNPSVMSLKGVLEQFVDHRKEVVVRRTNNRLSAIDHRLEILAGLLIVYLNLDEVIRIIREEDDPKAIMIARWNLTEVQVESILNTRLRSLRKLEEMEIRKENEELLKEKAELQKIVNQSEVLIATVASELKELRKGLAKDPNCARKTQIVGQVEAEVISFDSMVEKEPLTIMFSEMGWLKAQKGHGLQNLKFKDGDSAHTILEVQSTDKIMFFTSFGKFYAIAADKISRGKGDGEPIRIIFDLASDERVVSMMLYDEGVDLLVYSSQGRGFLVNHKDILAQTKSGKNVLSVDDGFEALGAVPVKQEQFIVTLGENRRLLIFGVKEVPFMRKGKGVTLQKYKSGTLKALKIIDKDTPSSEVVKSDFKDHNLWQANRGAMGRLILVKTWVD